jgi:ligand-binding SRPBCC domain-containing protein/uncharacterized protein YbjT (DUF2867 family)
VPATILVIGATSEVGRASCLRLAREGHSILAWCADAPAATRVLGADVCVHSPNETTLASLLERSDAVLDLSSLGKRRPEAALALTELSVAWMRCARRPSTLVSVSRGGDAGIRNLGARVVNLRAGTLLDPEEGLLRSLLLLGAIGAGRAPKAMTKPISWIHRDDLVECAVRALLDTRFDGEVHAAAPDAVDPAEFAQSIARASGRDARALRSSAPAALWAEPNISKPSAADLPLAHPCLDDALADLLAPGCSVGPVQTRVDADYVRRHQPLRELRARATLDAPLSVIFPFFSRPENLGALTPRGLGFKLRRLPEGAIREGDLIDYLIRLGPIPVPWRTRIDRWQPPHLFADSQIFGPYRCWWHEHRFEAKGDATVMDDMVVFSPIGGRLAQPFAGPPVERMLRRIFSFRARAMRLRFGALR